MCALPQWECPAFRAGATAKAWLLCPPGPTPCRGNGAMWSGSDKQLSRVIEHALAALVQQHPEADRTRKALVGYSMGAAAALRLVSQNPGEYRGLMLVNAGNKPEPWTMRKAGVSRVALVAGALDMSRSKARDSARRLEAHGVTARFFSLEKTGHYFDTATEERMKESLLWLAEAL